MQSAPWIDILKAIPSQHLGKFMLRTFGGTEVVIQEVLIMEGECFAFKGRLAGSQDTGRIFFVPFDQIDFIGSLNPVKEEEFREWFSVAPVAPSTQEKARPANDAPMPTSPAKQSDGPQMNERQSALLDRVRARARSNQ